MVQRNSLMNENMFHAMIQYIAIILVAINKFQLVAQSCQLDKLQFNKL